MCAAPANEFIQKKVGDMTNSVSKLCDVGVYDANVATLKTRYYLDFVRGVVEYDANLNEIPSKTGFIGGCVIGSDNYYMHNTARHWSVGSLTASNEVLFNDAGKNTLGRANWTTSPIVAYANYIVIPSSYFAAWHVNSSRIGYQVRKYGTTEWITPTPQRSLAQRQSIIEDSEIIVFGNPFKAGDRLDLRAFNTNVEGTYYSPIIEVVVSDGMNSYPGGFSATSGGIHDAPTVVVFLGETVKTWLESISATNTNLPTGRYIYKGVNASGNGIPADAGWYYDLGPDYIAFRINSAGMVVESFKRNPPVDPENWDVVVSFRRTFPSPITGEVNYILNVRIPAGKPSYGVALTFSGNYRMRPTVGGGGLVYPYSITLSAGQRNAPTQVVQVGTTLGYDVVFDGIQNISPSGVAFNVKYEDWIE